MSVSYKRIQGHLIGPAQSPGRSERDSVRGIEQVSRNLASI